MLTQLPVMCTEPPKRVLHVTPSFYPKQGGIEEFVLRLCQNSRMAGFEAEVAVCDSGVAPPASYEWEGIKVHPLRCIGRSPFKWVMGAEALVDRFDIVHLHDPHIGGITARFARNKKRPIALSTHGGFFHTDRWSRLKQLYWHLAVPRLLRNVDLVVAASRSDKELFQNVSHSLVQIDNGIQFAPFAEAATRNAASRNGLVYVGRLARNKRIDWLLDAMAFARGEASVGHLDIVGDDSEGLLSGLQRRALELGISDLVTFHGRLAEDRLLDVVSSARFVVSASSYEGFGLSVVECMAAQCVPILNDIPPFRALLEDGSAGQIVAFENARAAGAAIATLARKDRAELAQAALAAQRVAERFAWSTVIGAFTSAYRGLLDPFVDARAAARSSPGLSATRPSC